MFDEGTNFFYDIRIEDKETTSEWRRQTDWQSLVKGPPKVGRHCSMLRTQTNADAVTSR